MSLFKKVMIIGLATMALGSAAMGDTPSKFDCTTIAQDQLKTVNTTQEATVVIPQSPAEAAPAVDNSKKGT